MNKLHRLAASAGPHERQALCERIGRITRSLSERDAPASRSAPHQWDAVENDDDDLFDNVPV
ncbi:hypothetical protein [uncultured Sulfitobacter sp.]|uniref:hypothetical protein n=1 Tax=uncultured Sulfitobacter sp. TaxID=191468 RepID=UPI002605C74A|nr:hypothetical protein [uncultured Sulfitobacter sp.]